MIYGLTGFGPHRGLTGLLMPMPEETLLNLENLLRKFADQPLPTRFY
jgi:hypothetical protein